DRFRAGADADDDGGVGDADAESVGAEGDGVARGAELDVVHRAEGADDEGVAAGFDADAAGGAVDDQARDLPAADGGGPSEGDRTADFVRGLADAQAVEQVLAARQGETGDDGNQRADEQQLDEGVGAAHGPIAA